MICRIHLHEEEGSPSLLITCESYEPTKTGLFVGVETWTGGPVNLAVYNSQGDLELIRDELVRKFGKERGEEFFEKVIANRRVKHYRSRQKSV